jgi:hypothetical protein
LLLGLPDGFELGLALGWHNELDRGSELGVLGGVAMGFPLDISNGLANGMRLDQPGGFELGEPRGWPDNIKLGSKLGMLRGVALKCLPSVMTGKINYLLEKDSFMLGLLDLNRMTTLAVGSQLPSA